MTEQFTKSLNIAFYKRTHAGETIQDVSRATGLSPMTISRIENGIYSSGYDKLETLARHHGITIDAYKAELAREEENISLAEPPDDNKDAAQVLEHPSGAQR